MAGLLAIGVFRADGSPPVSLYLFAIFRGADGARNVEAEYPLTSSDYYLAFYVSAPLLGALAAMMATPGISHVVKFLFSVSLGTLGTTFLVWIVIDPVIGMIEGALPASRRHRNQRKHGAVACAGGHE